jgi:phosphatidylglycerol:prolipoprotein diacylglycerol transferase
LYPVIHLTRSLNISTYYLIISLATVVSTLWFIRRAEARKLERVVAIDFTLTCVVAGFLGARLLHVFYEEPAYYRAHPWAVLEIWNGGFVFLGGLAAAFMAGVFFCQWRKQPFWVWADAAVLPASLAYGLGRIGCFFNGCCFGGECHLPWAVFMDGAYRHPTQLYASFWELAWLMILRRTESKLKISGMLFNVWLVGHASGRIAMELFRADPRGDFIWGLSLGIWMSLALIAIALGQILAPRLH